MLERSNNLRTRLARGCAYLTLAAFVVLVGASLYEYVVVDSAWLSNPALIQPARGGLDRKDFWIPAHAGATILLLATLWMAWSNRKARFWLLWALGGYLVMRLWTFAYFVPLALSFEVPRDLSPDMLGQARQWVTLSILRLPLLVASTIALWVGARRLETGMAARSEQRVGPSGDVATGAPPLTQS